MTYEEYFNAQTNNILNTVYSGLKKVKFKEKERKRKREKGREKRESRNKHKS